MREGFIPSLDQMRRSHDGQWDVRSPHGAEAASEFDRWLAARDTFISEMAWDECLQNIDDHELNTEQARAGNPYRIHPEEPQ